MPVNWCTSCKCVLANEEVVNGVCERCGSEVIRKEKSQWMLKITEYAQRLHRRSGRRGLHRAGQDPAEELDRPLHRRGGHLQDHHRRRASPSIPPVPDTLFGATYMVISPEHALLKKLAGPHQELGCREPPIRRRPPASPTLSARELNKEKTGVRLEGVEAINPVTGKEMPHLHLRLRPGDLRHRRHHGRPRPRSP